MKKKLDTNQITNELKDQSLYFEDQSKRLSKKSDDKPANARTGERPNARTDERTNARTRERVNGRTSERTNVRTDERANAQTGTRKKAKCIIKRHSYQFYIDQVEDIKSLWISYQARGMDIELSDLAREAFDAYLTRIKEKANERANGRTSERTNARTGERANGRTQKKRLDKGK
jgi:hypothetical protein